jgi:hypothetical protein
VQIGIDEVLRPDIEVPQRIVEILSVAGAIETVKCIQLARAAEADILNAERRPGRGIEGNDGAIVAPRDDEDEGWNRSAGNRDEIIGNAVANLIGEELLRYGDDWLEGAVVDDAEAAG